MCGFLLNSTILLLLLWWRGVLCSACPADFGEEFDRCLTKIPQRHGIEHFVEKILTTTRLNQFDELCGNYTQFKVCANKLLSQCPEQRHLYRVHYGTAEEIVSLICDLKKGYRSHSILCIVSQRYGLLSRRCDVVYNVRVLSQSAEPCSLLSEMLSCKDALVRSACGGTAADTVFRLHQILYRNAVKDQCKPALNEFRSPAEFIYDNRCTYSFPNRLDFCYNKFRESIPRVYKAFPVVIQGTYIDVAKPCRALSDYNKCIDPVTSMCSSGIRYIDDAFHWHTKTDMARVMCKISSDYIRHMVCYKDVVMKRDTKQCQTSKNITDKMLTDYYMYKCKTKSREKLELIDKNIKDLISCYERIVKARCGADAARTILPLLRVKYQTKQFRMDCTGKRVPLVTGNNYFIDHTSGNDRHFKITHYLSVLFQFLIVRLLSKINCR